MEPVIHIGVVANEEAATIVTDLAGRCGACGLAHYFFISRLGRTVCVDCYSKERDAQDGVE